FSTHRDETEEHVARLEKVFEIIGKRPRGKMCDAILGIIAEGEQVIEDVRDGAVRDAGILAAAQAAEHYEIARYGTLREWAKLLGHKQAHDKLSQILDMEKAANAKLTGLAIESVNVEA